jgi:hypothetical protein
MRRVAVLVAAVALVTTGVQFHARAQDASPVAATPRAQCGPGSVSETGMQGRVSADDVASGRAKDGFRCNTEVVGRFGNTGGFRVHRYVDAAGHECGYYDTTPLFPTSVLAQGAELFGVYVLDMSDPAHPVKTDNLMTPAMLSPHESLSINQERGLLAAGMGGPATMPGIVDIYDLTQDCRHPVLKSSTPFGLLGHEGAFSPDGNTFWVTSTSFGSIVALDVTDPTLPTPIWSTFEHRIHGMNISDDGNRLYGARLGGGVTDGVTIFDVSQVQARKADPQVPVVSQVSWPNVSIPQTAIPVTISGHPYLVEVDEFAGGPVPSTAPDARVGAGRIIDIADDTKPKVISEMRLEVNQPENRAQLSGDPGMNNPVAGYAGHYCAVPQRTEPGIVACSFILSGLRIFDIRDPLHPKELAYFNGPPTQGFTNFGASSFAMSAPTFVPERGEVWYADGNSGFYALRLTNDVWPFKAQATGQAEVLAQTQTKPAPAPADTGAGRLPSTGGNAPWAAAAGAALTAALLTRRLSRRAAYVSLET